MNKINNPIQSLHLKLIAKSVTIRIHLFVFYLIPKVECVSVERIDFVRISRLDNQYFPRYLKKTYTVCFLCFVFERIFSYNQITEVGIIYPAKYDPDTDSEELIDRKLKALNETEFWT